MMCTRAVGHRLTSNSLVNTTHGWAIMATVKNNNCVRICCCVNDHYKMRASK